MKTSIITVSDSHNFKVGEDVALCLENSLLKTFIYFMLRIPLKRYLYLRIIDIDGNEITVIKTDRDV